MILESFITSAYRLGGTSTQKSLQIFPVYRFSILWMIKSAILETLGTIPDPSPL
jgi:hypothetical protein